jgi:hypothetical protein
MPKDTIESEDVASLLARVFAHPDLPYAVWSQLADAFTDIDNNLDKYKNPAVLRELLRLHAKQEAERQSK